MFRHLRERIVDAKREEVGARLCCARRNGCASVGVGSGKAAPESSLVTVPQPWHVPTLSGATPPREYRSSVRPRDSVHNVKPRHCTRTGCRSAAVTTLTYAYADSTAVVGPLALRAEPGSYDLCDEHSSRISAPRGWELIRLPLDEAALGPDPDDLLALAEAVRRVGMSWESPAVSLPEPPMSRRRGHLGVVADPGESIP